MLARWNSVETILSSTAPQHESLDGEAKGGSADIMGARAYG